MIRFLRLLFPKPEVDFALLAFLQLFALWNDIGWLAMTSKALLMPCLLFWVWPFTANKPWFRLAMLASWLGDVWLLWGEQPAFFMLGLGSFLVAQLAYAKQFWPGIQALRKHAWRLLPVIFVSVYLLVQLWPQLADLRWYVLIYVLAIATMASSALLQATGKTGAYLWIGATMFMLSDALLAWEKFVEPFPLASFWIMFSYMTAQWALSAWMVRSRG